MNYRFYTIIAICIVCFTAAGYAKIFRVGYTGPQVAGTDYATFQTAHDDANVGDTLLFYPGNNYYGDASKRLVYLGNGYLLSGDGANAGLQLITGSIRLEIGLHSGTDGSHFEGLGENGQLYLNAMDGIDNVIIRRCYYPFIYSGTTQDCSNWQITQTYNVYIHPTGNGGTGRFLNLRLENSHISYFDFRFLTPGSTGQISNCIIANTGILAPGASFSFTNNICQGSSFTDMQGSLFENNLFDYAEGAYDIPTGSNNQFSIDMSTVFIGSAGNSTDGQWQLKAGSPAIGAGRVGATVVDCGMFGGINPYRLSGIPSIPVFYKLTAPSRTATTNPYTITFSVKSNN